MFDAQPHKPILIGFFILCLYLLGNGMVDTNSTVLRKHWSATVDTEPQWLIADNAKLHGLTVQEEALLGDDDFDTFHETALSKEARPLRVHIQSTYKVPQSDVVNIVAAVLRYSHAHQIAPELVFSVIDSESSFRMDAKSSVGARGLMQVLPVWHQEKIKIEGGSNDLLWTTEFNIKIGTQILREYITRSKGNIKEALARYNGSLGLHNGYPEKVLRGRDAYRKFLMDLSKTA